MEEILKKRLKKWDYPKKSANPFYPNLTTEVIGITNVKVFSELRDTPRRALLYMVLKNYDLHGKVTLDVDNLLIYYGEELTKSRREWYMESIKELLEKNILARTYKKHIYWLNTHIVNIYNVNYHNGK